MSKIKFFLSVLLLTNLLNTFSYSQEVPTIYFVNGIRTTFAETIQAMNEVKDLIATSNNRYVGSRKKFYYDFVYNPYGDKTDESDDNLWGSWFDIIGELLPMKEREEEYIYDLANIVSPHDDLRHLDSTTAKNIVTDFYSQESDSIKIPVDQLHSIVSLSNEPIIVVAHSQGNLIANYAWINLVATEIDVNKKLRIVNVANTSFLSLNSLDLTHKDDGALYRPKCNFISLESLPGTAGISSQSVLIPYYYGGRSSDFCTTSDIAHPYCDFQVSAPTFKSNQDLGCPGHGFDQNIYLSNAYVEPIKEQNISRGENLGTSFKSYFEDLIYTAAESLDKANEIPEPIECEVLNSGSVSFEFNESGNDIVHTNNDTNEITTIATINETGIYMWRTDYENCYYHLMMGDNYSLFSVNLRTEEVREISIPDAVEFSPIDLYKNNTVIGIAPTDQNACGFDVGEMCPMKVYSADISSGTVEEITTIIGGVPRQFGMSVDKNSDTVTFVGSVGDNSSHGTVDTEYVVNLLNGNVISTRVISGTNEFVPSM